MSNHLFTKVNVSGDGSCYFHAVAGYLRMEKKTKKINKQPYTYYERNIESSNKLRKKVVSWLKNNLTYKLPNGLTIRDDIIDAITLNPHLSSIEDYLQSMLKNTSYAGQIEITATAILLNRNIRVYILNKGKYRNIGLGYQVSKSKNKDIILFHNLKPGKSVGDHFEILFPKHKATVIAKSKYLQLTKKKKQTKKKRQTRRRIKTKRI